MSKYFSKLMIAFAVLSIFGVACQNTSSVEDVPDAPTTEEATEQVEEEATIEDSFGDAVNVAMEAAEVTQTAKSAKDWEKVAGLWSQAIELMKAVPESSENYQTAQQKATEYQPNLEYAQQNAIAENTLGEAEEFYQAAVNAYLEQDMNTALRNFDRAIEVDPSYAQAYYNRGLVKIKLAQKDAAIKDLEKAAELFAALNDENGVYQVKDRLQQLESE